MKKLILGILLTLPLVTFAHRGTAKTIELNAYGSNRTIRQDFGTVFSHTQNSLEYRITAKNGIPAEIQDVQLSGLNFHVNTNCPNVLTQGQQCAVRLTYWPSQKTSNSSRQYDTGLLVIKFADSRVVIKLSGEAL
ncbi:hypothetical protein ACLVWU_05675 [Bdellovibrio sp. HCB290]|uniref:hypothetical protein n=1 Tax=Bdellovibrio sp. HCB290 TaxID=3394356 RepID=UPI0039B3C392